MKLAVLKGFKGGNIISSLPYSIGRCRSADLIIAHVNVSRNHCKIFKENGLWKIYDFSSSGTFVNDTLIGQGKSVTLNNGDRIRFGPFESNLCWTFYSFDVSNENSADLGVTQEFDTFQDNDEKNVLKGNDCCGKGTNMSVTFKENDVFEENKEILKNSDSKFKGANEKLVAVKEEKATNVGHAQHNENSQAAKEKSESEKVEELMKELQNVRQALSNLEEKNCKFQKELTMENNRIPSSDTNLLENFANLMEAEFQCTICSELFVTAVTLSCTHTFCKHCINQWKKKQKTCPICRKKITNETQSLVVDNYIDKMVGNLSHELKERRETIIKERKEIEPCRKRSKLKK